eukprot:54621_1
MSQTEKFSPEEKQMELDEDTDLIAPPPIAKSHKTFENLSNDLQYLYGTKLPMELLSQLQTANITTFEDILLVKIKDISPDMMDTSQLIKLQQIIASNFYTSVQIKPLSCIIAQNKTQINYHSTAIPSLDALINEIHPGIPTKSITSFIGAASSGKTLMLYQIAASCALNGGCVIFVDCHNQFDGQRFYDALQSIQSQTKTESHVELERIMKRVLVYSVCNLMETMDLMQSDGFISKVSANRVDMILIDNMDLNTYLYELNTTFHCHAQICKLARRLKYLAVKYNLSVITSSLSLSNVTQHNYWIRSSYCCLFKNWYNYIDNEVHLLLTTHFGTIRPILTKSRKNVTYKKDCELVLSIKSHISETSFSSV